MEKTTPASGEKLIRIAVTGPESTGKTTLAKALAAHYQTVVVKEAARRFLNRLNRPYVYEDLAHIACKQTLAEYRGMKKGNKYVFFDTEFTVLKIWALERFGDCPEIILNRIRKNHYDLYLLCNIDLNWVNDPLRENPHNRSYLFHKFEEEMIARKLPYTIISGQGEARLQKAIAAIDALGR